MLHIISNIIKKIFPAVLCVFAFVPLYARDVEITVMDLDLGIPLEGAVIRGWDGSEYVCDSDGTVRLTAPDDRPVVVQGAYPGYESGRLQLTLAASSFTLNLRLSGVMESRELVIEAARPGSSESKTGRSVAVSEREIAQSAEIGIIEDVMTVIKLLPGVGYSGFFNAQPSIRGGFPGDMNASLDGFYVFNPYHWGGSFSIFDPKMVQSATLSHGVFSTRYGHTISGLLDITAKKPSHTETEFELGINTSAANFNLSLPLAGKGGVMLMGRVTYYDPVIWLAKQLGKVVEELAVVNSIRVAPYIRSGAVTANYRFTDNLDLQATGFWGMDGAGATYANGPAEQDGYSASTDLNFDYTNYQGFITAGLSWNPRNDMLLKFTAGTGYEQSDIDGTIQYDISGKTFSDAFKVKYPYLTSFLGDDAYTIDNDSLINQSDYVYNAQGRLDYDWEIGKGFLFAAGVQELFTLYTSAGDQQITAEKILGNMSLADQTAIFGNLGITDISIKNILLQSMFVSYPVRYSPDADNKMLTTSGYGLFEYASAEKKFAAELGLRVDHYYLIGRGFTLQTKPVLNPRLNLDYNVFRNKWIFESLDISAGTGLFASMDKNVFSAEEQYNIDEAKPSRSLTSVLGAKLELPESLSFSIEGYYKYVFDRMYVPVSFSTASIDIQPQFDGEGTVWGIDLMLQKLQSRYWDGWLSYSYSWAKYRDPHSGNSDAGVSGGSDGDDWYFPSFHRFHHLNLVLNIKPAPRINIYTRLTFASGSQISERAGDSAVSYPVYVYDSNDPGSSYFIEKYYWPVKPSSGKRTTPSLPLDIKFSILGNNRAGKTRYELYVAVENVLGLLYSAQGNTSFNQYTGKEDTGSMSATYEMPIPIPSFGFKIAY